MSSRREELEATWVDCQIDLDTLSIEEDGTLEWPAANTDVEPEAGSSLARLLVLTGDESADVELGDLIGEGGMGVVYQARQRSLRRDVAVKTVRPALSGIASEQLLREARVTGALEHPNVVPVHGLGVDEHGRPLIIMKRLTGLPWGAASAPELRSPRRLDRDLQIFEHLCNAVAFAHERGVLHRDIKPANVVLGDFGEVCLLDWGLAVALGPTEIPDLPRVEDVASIDGSLLYMAPEQVAGRGSALGVHTDVYLLGATLYEILSGRPPRALRPGIEARELLFEAFTNEPPPLPEHIPAELRAICARAMAMDPRNRFESALALRDALGEFRAHRESSALVEEARLRLRAATRAVTEGEETSPGVPKDLAAARFGFEQALRSWPDNAAARSALRETILVMVERELAAERPAAAAALLDDLTEVAPIDTDDTALRDRVARLRSDVEARRHRVDALEEAARQSDLGMASKSRRRYGIAIGLCLMVAHLVLFAVDRAVTEVTHAIYLATTSAVGLSFAIPAMALRRRLFPNAANIRMAYTLAVLLAAQVAVFAALWAYGVGLAPTLAASLLQLAGSIAIKTALLAPRAQWTGAVALACAAGAAAAPAVVLPLVGVAYAAYFLGGGLLSWDDTDPQRLLGLRGND